MTWIEFVIARIFKLVRPGIERVGRGLSAPFVEAFGIEARRTDDRIALGAAIDGSRFDCDLEASVPSFVSAGAPNKLSGSAPIPCDSPPLLPFSPLCWILRSVAAS